MDVPGLKGPRLVTSTVRRRQFLALAAIGPTAGCARLSGDGEDQGRLDLTVQNDRDEPLTARVTVVDDDGTTYADESDRLESGVARTFEVVVATAGRHEATVVGEDWRGQLAWNADTCALFGGVVRVTDDSVEVAGECVDPR